MSILSNSQTENIELLEICDKYHPWSDKSKDIPFDFKSNNCVGNGEAKLAKELGITTSLGGQNSSVDLIHPGVLGNISVKDMTDDDCILGTEGCKNMRKIFRKIPTLFVCWTVKYKSRCELAKEYYDAIDQKYGSARIILKEGIDKLELASGGKKKNPGSGNWHKLVQLLEKLKQDKKNYDSEYKSLSSEYIEDIIYNLGDKSLQDLMNDCVRKEATEKTLIIVHREKGWLVVKDTTRLTCPRITKGAPRINYS
tara:strand:+ start:3073 stop:3834 length:762 start_codon:yes stop_codon:yes gene_type:complete